ncbi:Gfo/Idh/MocA family protein [Sunxiuqinia sp. A32]|uniref:Gfo/Idh/MocA family protein n=1 Tax=Sunxiuqinia sp. A32 TaxID=3461496 RepID=UPI004045F08D
MKKYKIGILGCGKVAHLHAKAIHDIPEAELIAVWSRSKETAENFAAKYKVKAYQSITKMISENQIDLVVVCTPHPFHKNPVIDAAKAGANILVEKPLASTLKDCDDMISACEQYGVELGVISQRRWYAPVQRVKKAIEDGKIGRPVLGTITMLGWRDEGYYAADAWRGTWKMEGGGVLVNQAPHQLDILLWMMGDIDEVYGIWRNLNHPYIEVDDTAVVIVKFKNGGIGNILVSNSQKPGIHGKVHIHGENGSSVGVQTDGGAMFIAGSSEVLEPPVNDLWTISGEEHMLTQWNNEDSDHFQKIEATVYYMKEQIQDFINALKEGRNPIVTGEQGRKTVELFSAIYRSTRYNKPIKFPLVSDAVNENDMDGRLSLK